MNKHYGGMTGWRNAKANDDEDEPTDGRPRAAYHHFEHTYTAQHIHYYLSGNVGAPSDYVEMIHRIATAGPNDTVFIHLNTPGGQVNTGVQLINAMQNSQAKIITILESQAHSLGTLILLAGDEIVINDNCLIMIHTFRGGVGGKGNELGAELDATSKWFTDLARKIYIPFVTEDEFARILRGEDLWLHTPDIRKRLDRVIKSMAEEAEKPKKPRRTKKSEQTEQTEQAM